MTNTTDTKSAILVIRKGDRYISSERYLNREAAETTRDALVILMPSFTFGVIEDTTDVETANAEGVSFEVESANGKVKHNIPSYPLARRYAKRYATADNSVTIRQVLILEDLTVEGETAEAYAAS